MTTTQATQPTDDKESPEQRAHQIARGGRIALAWLSALAVVLIPLAFLAALSTITDAPITPESPRPGPSDGELGALFLGIPISVVTGLVVWIVAEIRANRISKTLAR